MYRTIVVGTDGSPTANLARQAAARLARQFGARLIVVCAHEPPAMNREMAQEVAERARAASLAEGVADVEVAVLRGAPEDAILQVATEAGASLVVVGNKGMGSPSRFRLGAAPDRVAHFAASDVLIVDTTRFEDPSTATTGRYRRILAATDGSPTANEAVRRAYDLAGMNGAAVILVHVGDPVVGQIRLETTARGRPENVEVDLRTVEGDPAEQICELAEGEGADLVVVGNKGMSGARRFLLGSVPNRVAHYAPTDVLIARTVDLSVFDVEPGHGAVLDMDGRKTAVYRDPEGQVHAVSARCTHLGCTVGWNDGDRTWDCPCHGSRFDAFGRVLRGPARTPLEGAPAEPEAASGAAAASEAAVAVAQRSAGRPDGAAPDGGAPDGGAPDEAVRRQAPAVPEAPGHRIRSDRTFVILGAGLAGANAALALRREGFDGRLVLIGEENHYPYERPPLSKTFLRGEAAFEEALVAPVEWYRREEVELRFAATAVSVSVSGERAVVLGDGERVAFDRLLIATGARNSRPPIPGLDLPGVHLLRTVADAERIREEIEPGRRVVIGGMGFIGSEVAASLRTLGLDVVAVDGGRVPLQRVLGEEVGGVLAEVHAERGVRLHGEDRIAAFEGDGRVRAVLTESGRRFECDLAVVGFGVKPNVEVLEGSGVAIESGVLVDEQCRTNVEGVFAAGDVANHLHPLFGRRMRVEHWQNAIRQGEAAALNMLGRGDPYDEVHWFWSDQYDQNLQYAGYHTEWDELVVRGSLDDRDFTAFYTKDGRVLAAVAMNRGSEIEDAMAVIRAAAPVPADRLRDEDVRLGSLVG